MLDPFADDSSSTNEEIQRLWDKLDTIESCGQLEREERNCHCEISTPPPFEEIPPTQTIVVTAESKEKQSKTVDERIRAKMKKLPPFHETLSSSSSSSSSSPFPVTLKKNEKALKKDVKPLKTRHKNWNPGQSRQDTKGSIPSNPPPMHNKTPMHETSEESTSSDSHLSSSSSNSSSSSSTLSSSSPLKKLKRVVVKSEPPSTVEVRPQGSIHSPLSMPQFGSQSPLPRRTTESTANLENKTSSEDKKGQAQGLPVGSKSGSRLPIKNPYASRKSTKKADAKAPSSSRITATTSSRQNDSASPFFQKKAMTTKENRGKSKTGARESTTVKDNKRPNEITRDDVTMSTTSSSDNDLSCTLDLSSKSSSPSNLSKSINPFDNYNKTKQDNGEPDPLDVPIQDYQPEEEAAPEIDPSLLSPPPYKEKPRPVLHQFSLQNRPMETRTKIPVANLFSAPIHQLWRNKFNEFNHLQSEVANMLCHSDDNTVVSAPTGAGKTAIFEMGLARFILRDLQFHEPVGPQSMSKHRKVVYFAPSKALCEERYEDWTHRLSQLQLGIEVSMITGDAEPGRSYHDLATAHLILTTPEKWDSILRRWTENFYLIASVKLLLLDEVHQLGDPSRGCCLEAIITRMKHVHCVSQKVQFSQADLYKASYKNTSPEAISACLRIIAVSATLPNILDVAEFVGANEAFAFDDSYRPVPLVTRVVGLGYIGKNEYRFWTNLDEQIPHLLARYAERKPTLIFCHTKKETETLAKHLISKNFGNPSNTSNAPPGSVQYCLDSGVAYHHAGIQASERRSIERAFANKTLRCLCATSTLAVGVNLPAHLVIIKGTRTWRGGGAGYEEIDSRSLLQMIGRAGRPGMDTSGMAIIMTDNASKLKYESLARGLGSAESQLIPKLIDVVNTEISQRVIKNIDDAVRWLKTTFLFACIKENPPRFGVDLQSQTLDNFITNQCSSAIESLYKCGLVGKAENLLPLAGSHIMSQSMVPFEAMEMIAGLPFDATQCQILRVLSNMKDLHVPVRRLEKRPLNACHKSEAIRYKLEGPLSKARIQDPSEKTFVLLQAHIAHQDFENFTLRQEMSSLADKAQCVLMAAQEHSTRGSKHGQVALQCLKLRRSLQLCLWGESSGVLNQIQDIGHKCTAQLKINGIVSFEQVMAATEDQIERASGRSKPFGKRLHTIVSTILQEKLAMTAEIEYTRESNIPASVQCHLRFPNQAPLNSKVERAKVNYTLFSYTDRPGSMLFFQDGITSPGSYRFSCPVNFGKIFLHLFSSVVGLDASCVLDGNQKVQSSTFVPSSKKVPPTNVKKSRQTQQRKERDFSNTQTFKAPKEKDSRNHGKARASRAGPVLSTSKSCAKGQSKAYSATKSLPASGRGEAARGETKKITTLPQRLPEEPIRVTPHTGGYLQNRFSQIVSGRADRYSAYDCEITQPLGRREGRKESRQYPREPFTPPAIARPVFQESSSNKRSLPTSWNQTRRKQQRSQQRAFASKRDNPFAHFQHDPNDAESYLEGLCSQSQTQRRFQKSLIPQSKLNHLQNYSNAVGQPQRKKHTLGYGRQRMDRQGRKNGPYHPLSNQELLQRKAEESHALARPWSQLSREVESAEHLGDVRIVNSYPHYEQPKTRGPEKISMNSSWQNDHQTSIFKQSYEPQTYPSIAQQEAFPVPITQQYQNSTQEEMCGSEMTWHSPTGPATGLSYLSGDRHSSFSDQKQMQAPQQVVPLGQHGYQIGWSPQPDEDSHFREVFF